MTQSGTPFVHEHAICETDDVGDGTRIWAFAHVLPGATIGRDCNICDGVFVEGGATIGDRVTVKCGVQLWDGIDLHDDVFVGPNATFTNDPYPRSRQWLETYPRTVVRAGASIGANATILPGLEIGEGAMVGAGAVVTRSVPAGAVVVGNPGRIIRRAEDSRPSHATPRSAMTRTIQDEPAGAGEIVQGCRLVELPRNHDHRGNLTAIENSREIPFDIQRVYYLYDVPGGEARAGHAHHALQQLVIAASGSFDLLLDDGAQRAVVTLNRAYQGLLISNTVWREIHNFSSGAVCLVLASHPYDEGDYIRDYADFLEHVGSDPTLERPTVRRVGSDQYTFDADR